MATSNPESNETSQQGIEELTKRYQDLNTRKIQAQTNLENAKKQLAELKKKAKKEYGTDELDELQKQLEDIRAENEEKRSKYQASLDLIEEKLEEVEKKHGPLDEVEAVEDAEEQH
jgi:predicted  nucleic acid-binding Zn-ribbon protein